MNLYQQLDRAQTLLFLWVCLLAVLQSGLQNMKFAQSIGYKVNM